MPKSKFGAAGLASMALLAGCASTPSGPTVPVLPQPNKPFQAFQQEDVTCKQYAGEQVRGQAESANAKGVGAAVLGTALGLGLGAAVGGSHSLGVGAATGAVGGTAVGAGYSEGERGPIQQQYDIAYSQCMYSQGNQVAWAAPWTGPVAYDFPRTAPYPTPAPAYTYPQQPGYAPPPPSQVR